MMLSIYLRQPLNRLEYIECAKDGLVLLSFVI